ncbi:MAG: ribosome hibernation-promoting factor, HPF/YfiA family [Fusobacteriaceae bacterium]
MKMIIHGRHLPITPAIRQYAEEKIGKVSKFLDTILEIDVTLSAEKLKTGNYHRVDALIFANGVTVKGSSTEQDLYAAIDDVADVLEVQLKKIKEKRRDDVHLGSIRELKYNPETKMVAKQAERTVVTTSVSPRPMGLEEAILQLECLGRSFYAFMNAETNEMNVVYKREDGDYGHIEADAK